MFFFFFFQAEDGIRDWSVTGVQTCALPIYPLAPVRVQRRSRSVRLHHGTGWVVNRHGVENNAPRRRSEERRVGKECRSRWWPEQEKKEKVKMKEQRQYERTLQIHKQQSKRV